MIIKTLPDPRFCTYLKNNFNETFIPSEPNINSVVGFEPCCWVRTQGSLPVAIALSRACPSIDVCEKRIDVAVSDHA